MKKIKLLPLLLVMPVLAGCGSKPSKPKFVDYGKELKFDAFSKKFEAALGKTYVETDKIRPSGINKHESKHYFESELKRNDKVIETNIQLDVEANEYKYDSKNVLIEGTTKGSETTQKKSKTEDVNKKTAYNYDYTYQKVKVDKKEYIATVYKKIKEYLPAAEIEKGVSTDKSIMSDIAGYDLGLGYVAYSNLIFDYVNYDDEGKKDYKFYNNENVFTIEIKSEFEVETKNAEDKVVYVTKGTREVVFQYSVEKNKLWHKYYDADDYQDEYKLDKDNEYAKGDVKHFADIYVEEGSWEEKDVSLKAVDLTGYTRNGDEW